MTAPPRGSAGPLVTPKKTPTNTPTRHHPHLGPAGHADMSAVKLELSWLGVMSQAAIQQDTAPAGRGSRGKGELGGEGGVARHLCRSMQTAGLLAAAVHASLFQGAT